MPEYSVTPYEDVNNPQYGFYKLYVNGVMSRKEILSSPEYWMAKAQLDLYNHAEDFMEKNDMNRTQLALHLGVSKGYVSQLLNGDFDHRLSKFFELALAFGLVPKIEFRPIDEILAEDRNEFNIPKLKKNVTYMPGNVFVDTRKAVAPTYETLPSDLNISVA